MCAALKNINDPPGLLADFRSLRRHLNGVSADSKRLRVKKRGSAPPQFMCSVSHWQRVPAATSLSASMCLAPRGGAAPFLMRASKRSLNILVTLVVRLHNRKSHRKVESCHRLGFVSWGYLGLRRGHHTRKVYTPTHLPISHLLGHTLARGEGETPTPTRRVVDAFTVLEKSVEVSEVGFHLVAEGRGCAELARVPEGARRPPLILLRDTRVHQLDKAEGPMLIRQEAPPHLVNPDGGGVKARRFGLWAKT